MKRALLTAVALAAAAASPAARADAVHLAARETLALPFPGAVAVFAVDPSTVEASQAGGQVVLLGRRAGRTLVTVVLPERVETLTVDVAPPPPLLPSSALLRQAGDGFWEQRYDTANGRYTSGLAASFGDSQHGARLRLEGLHESHGIDGQRRFALPAASLALDSPERTVVLLDELVRESPLTVDGAVLRGAHLHQGPLHAYLGVQSDQPFGDLLLPGSGDRALGLAWNPGGAGLRLVPRFLWLPDSRTAVPGVVSLGVEGGAPADRLQFRGELGWSDRPGAAFDLDFRGTQRQLWLRAQHRPRGFAALRLGRAAGDEFEGAWTERLGHDTVASVTALASRLALEEGRPEAKSARAELRHQLSPQWSVTAAAGRGTFRGVAGDSFGRSTLALGAAYDRPDFGAGLTVRHQQGTTGDGFGMRLASRLALQGWRGNAFIDAQQQAPTVPLLLQDRPDLARALAELGLTSNDPEQVLQLLRDNAALLATRGVTVGRLELQPLRVQAGLEVSWRGSAGAPEFGARLLMDRSPGLEGGRGQTIATLYAGWRLSARTDLGLSYSRASWRRGGFEKAHSDSFQVSLRTTFSTLAMPGSGTQAITGIVLREEAGQGGSTPAAGVEVVLDRSRRTTTDRDGRFTFERPGTGGHRVEAVLPTAAGVYFASPSILTLQPGGQANFGLVYSAALLTGVLSSDAGEPIGGTTVRLQGTREATTTTDSAGVYRFAAPEGNVQVSVDPASLPPGYELGDLQEKSAILARGAPAEADFVVRAQRALRGVVQGVKGETPVIAIEELGRELRPDAQGRFVLRGLPAGPLTLVVKTARGSTRQVVQVPAGPGTVEGIELRMP